MNRHSRRAAEKAKARGRTDDVSSRLSPQAIQEAHMSAEIKQLLQNASGAVSQALVATCSPDAVVKPADAIVLVVDGTSPMAPPELKKIGKKGFGVGASVRAQLAKVMAAESRVNPAIAEKIGKGQTCGREGHVDVCVSVASGCLIGCAECDLGFKRTAPEPVSPAAS